MKKILSPIVVYVLLVILLVLSWLFASGNAYTWFGKGAAILLVVTLFISPMSRVFSWKGFCKLMAYRRQMGIATFWLALFHGFGFILKYEFFSLSYFNDPRSHLFYGFVALFGLLVLAVTSNDLSVRVLKRNWKRVQYLVYPVLFLVLLHIALVSESFINFALLSFAYVLLKILDWKKIKLL